MRRSKKKDIFLDFTSLLDVTLLLLFFFVMSFHADMSKAEAEIQEKAIAAEDSANKQLKIAKIAELEAEKSKSKYDDLINKNSTLKNELERNIEIINKITSKEAEEIISFNSGNNLKIILKESKDETSPMSLRVVYKNQVIGECVVTERHDDEIYQKDDITAEKLIAWLVANDISDKNVIMCDLVYDSSERRSYLARRRVENILNSLHSEYGYDHFYFSTTNYSIGTRKKDVS